MDLKSIILPERVVEFDFPGCEGLKFKLSFLSKESNQKLYNKCQVTKFDAKTRKPMTKFDDELFLELYVKSVVKGWTGFKLKYLNELLLIDVEEDQLEEELPFSEENAIELVKNSNSFDNWVTEVLDDISNFTNFNSKKKSEE